MRPTQLCVCAFFCFVCLITITRITEHIHRLAVFYNIQRDVRGPEGDGRGRRVMMSQIRSLPFFFAIGCPLAAARL